MEFRTVENFLKSNLPNLEEYDFRLEVGTEMQLFEELGEEIAEECSQQGKVFEQWKNQIHELEKPKERIKNAKTIFERASAYGDYQNVQKKIKPNINFVIDLDNTLGSCSLINDIYKILWGWDWSLNIAYKETIG